MTLSGAHLGHLAATRAPFGLDRAAERRRTLRSAPTSLCARRRQARAPRSPWAAARAALRAERRWRGGVHLIGKRPSLPPTLGAAMCRLWISLSDVSTNLAEYVAGLVPFYCCMLLYSSNPICSHL